MSGENVQVGANRALKATEAGEYLALRIGLSHAIPAQRMWHYARVGLIPAVKLGRRVWFQAAALDLFAANGGRGYAGTTLDQIAAHQYGSDWPAANVRHRRSRTGEV